MKPVTYPSKDISSYFISLKNMYPKAYDKHKTSADILSEINKRFNEYDESIGLVITVEHSYV